QAIYQGIVDDQRSNTFGYLGDVGDYPARLSDLISPSPVPAGWNGPYIQDARIENSIVYDRFGGPIEYFRPTSPPVPSAPLDQLALISRGPDRTSTNTAADPNKSSNFTGLSAANSGYGNAINNVDNVVYPRFTDN